MLRATSAVRAVRAAAAAALTACSSAVRNYSSLPRGATGHPAAAAAASTSTAACTTPLPQSSYNTPSLPPLTMRWQQPRRCMSSSADLDKFDTHAKQLAVVIDAASASMDPDRIHNAQDMANDYIDGYNRAISQYPNGDDGRVNQSKELIGEIQESLKNMLVKGRGRMEVGVINVKGMPDDTLKGGFDREL
eukprot:gene12230-16415_t